MSCTLDDRPPTQRELRDLTDSVVALLSDELIKLGIAIGAHAADGNEFSAAYARETLSRAARELRREIPGIHRDGGDHRFRRVSGGWRSSGALIPSG